MHVLYEPFCFIDPQFYYRNHFCEVLVIYNCSFVIQWNMIWLIHFSQEYNTVSFFNFHYFFMSKIFTKSRVSTSTFDILSLTYIDNGITVLPTFSSSTFNILSHTFLYPSHLHTFSHFLNLSMLSQNISPTFSTSTFNILSHTWYFLILSHTFSILACFLLFKLVFSSTHPHLFFMLRQHRNIIRAKTHKCVAIISMCGQF